MIRVPISLALALLCAAALAQERAPGLSISPTFDSPRSHAPLQLDVRLTWNAPQVLEGRLQLNIYVDERLVHTWTSRDVALSNSEVTLAAMLPSPILTTEQESLNIEAFFLTPRGKFEYPEELHVLYWVDWKRIFCVGIVRTEGTASTSADFRTDSLDNLNWLGAFQLESMIPDPSLLRHFSTRVMQFNADRIPLEPLELAQFDLIVLTNDEWDHLAESQFNAIATWAEAGGSVCVAAGQSLSSAQRKFLERLSCSTPARPVIRFDDDGRLHSLDSNRAPWIFSSPGTGRALITLGPVDVGSPDWKQALLELWRVKADQRRQVRLTGTWKFDLPKDVRYNLENPFVHPLEIDVSSEPSLQPLLMPDRVAGVPFATVAAILTACLIAIGPGDYLLLSLLNRRRWTWILFPAIAIGTSFYTVRLAQSHMGKTDSRTSMTFVDITADGRAARSSRFELIFAASEKQTDEGLKQVFAVPLEKRAAVNLDEFGYPRSPTARYSGYQGVPTAPSMTQGRVPTNYSYVHFLRQWQPQLLRYTSLGPAAAISVPAFDWELENAAALREPAVREKLFREIQTAIPGSQALLLHQNQSYRSEAPAELVGNRQEGSHGRDPLELAGRICARPGNGIFQVVSQISPNEAGNFEDLTLLDQSDPDQWLLLVMTRDEEGRYIVYRRLLRANDQ